MSNFQAQQIWTVIWACYSKVFIFVKSHTEEKIIGILRKGFEHAIQLICIIFYSNCCSQEFYISAVCVKIEHSPVNGHAPQCCLCWNDMHRQFVCPTTPKIECEIIMQDCFSPTRYHSDDGDIRPMTVQGEI